VIIINNNNNNNHNDSNGDSIRELIVIDDIEAGINANVDDKIEKVDNAETAFASSAEEVIVVEAVNSIANIDVDENAGEEFVMKSENMALGANISQKKIPQKVLIKEKTLCQTLDILYDKPLKFDNKQVLVGGRLVILNAFHYSEENLAAPSNKWKREYIDESEDVTLYRWELKGALCTKFLKVGIYSHTSEITLQYFYLSFINIIIG